MQDTCAAGFDKVKVKLRFKETGAKKLKIATNKQTNIYETSWEKVRVHSFFEETYIYACAVKAMKKDLLEVKTKQYIEKTKLNSYVLKNNKTRSSDVNTFIMNSQGQKLTLESDVDMKALAEDSNIELQFPENAVGSGDRWNVIIPPSKNYPKPINLQFEVKRIVKKQLNLYYVIIMSYETLMVSLKRSCRIKVTSQNRIVFNASKGYVMRQTGRGSYITTWLQQGKGNPFQSARFTSMKMVLQ